MFIIQEENSQSRHDGWLEEDKRIRYILDAGQDDQIHRNIKEDRDTVGGRERSPNKGDVPKGWTQFSNIEAGPDAGSQKCPWMVIEKDQNKINIRIYKKLKLKEDRKKRRRPTPTSRNRK